VLHHHKRQALLLLLCQTLAWQSIYSLNTIAVGHRLFARDEPTPSCPPQALLGGHLQQQVDTRFWGRHDFVPSQLLDQVEDVRGSPDLPILH